MPDRTDRLAEILSHGILAVSVEDVVEAGLQRRSQRSIVAGPEPFHARRTRFLTHLQNVVALLQVEREAHNIPALFQGISILGARRVLQDFYIRKILAEEPETKGNAAWHLKTPAESFGSVLPIIIIEAEVSIDSGQQHAGHGQRLLNERVRMWRPGWIRGSI